MVGGVSARMLNPFFAESSLFLHGFGMIKTKFYNGELLSIFSISKTVQSCFKLDCKKGTTIDD